MCRDNIDIEVIEVCTNWNYTLSVIVCNNVTYFVDSDFIIYDKNPIVHPFSIVTDKEEISILVVEIRKYIDRIESIVIKTTVNLYDCLKYKYIE